MLLVDRSGSTRPVGADSGYYLAPRFSPDGKRLATARSTNVNYVNMDIWVIDLAQHTQTRVTFDTSSAYPLWSPDGKRIVYTKYVNGLGQFEGHMFSSPADGTGSPEPVTQQAGQWAATAFEPGGGMVYIGSPTARGKAEIWRVGHDSGSAPQRVLATAFHNLAPSLSPDGHWMAYATNESGRYEVYVRSYPGAGGRWQISLEGGEQPFWSPKGNEIFYRSGDAVMSAAVRTRPTFEVTGRTRLFSGDYEQGVSGWPAYTVSPDGKTFLMLQRVTGVRQAMVVTLNLFDELRRH
jgi:Tol biopolymer transport system component